MIASSRLFSVGNATKLLRALPQRTFTSSSTSAANCSKFSGIFTQNTSGAMAARHNLERFANQSQQPQTSRLFSSASFQPFAKAAPTASSPFLQGQAVRGFRDFSRRTWHAEQESAHQAANDWWRGARGDKHDFHKHIHDHWQKHGGMRGYHCHHRHGMRRRRPIRFLFRMAFLSTILVAVPAVVALDAPKSTLAYVPLTVFGTGAALLLTGRLLYVFLPVAAVGGAAYFWACTMPAATTVKDLKKILKRDENAGRYTTALSILGSEWEVQKARPDEWFRWTFPERGDKKQLDKIDIRMTVFDPKDQSNRKERALRKLDLFQAMDKRDIAERSLKCHKGKTAEFNLPESLTIKRDGDRVEIKMEEDGEKVMEQKVAKQYLAIGRVVDKAAKEIEAASGLKLGEQVVLVHKSKNRDAFWSGWAPYGDLELRIPFDRTWVNDLGDE
ncbi:hypothetical protein EDD21DRAFT_372890 [Dissophora ornata]|nr:hypothetical protein BGZ58_000659 [Dissophora ornata]KAI8602065.1 hypothetical protein EDD21DRAFT_372890 [Dissophora ornata]